MNPLGELLGVDDIRLDLDALDKAQLLEVLAVMLSRRVGLARADVLDSLVAREQLGSTGLSHGVAIPHARIAQCSVAAGVFVRTGTPIPFDAPDGRPVSLFIGLVVPKAANERHLKLLATAAEMFSDRTFRERLRTCRERADALDLLSAWPNPAGAAPGDSR
jgi:PTS system nitrogen regulatory IIA component